MKRLFPALAAATLLTLPVLAIEPTTPTPANDDDQRTEQRDRATVIDDVIRMSKAGVNDEAIIRFLRESRDEYVVDADIIIELTDAGVSKDVLNAVMDQAYRRGEDDRGRNRRGSTTVYVRPSWNPWFYPYGWYDPYWYGPRVSIGYGWGGWGGGRHHYSAPRPPRHRLR